MSLNLSKSIECMYQMILLYFYFISLHLRLDNSEVRIVFLFMWSDGLVFEIMLHSWLWQLVGSILP